MKKICHKLILKSRPVIYADFGGIKGETGLQMATSSISNEISHVDRKAALLCNFNNCSPGDPNRFIYELAGTIYKNSPNIEKIAFIGTGSVESHLYKHLKTVFAAREFKKRKSALRWLAE